jgi:Zn-dependent protease
MSLIFIIVALILSLTLHEFAHALVGHWLGDDTAEREGRLTLNPLAHIDPFTTLILPVMLILVQSPVVFGAARPVPFNPWAVRYGKWGAALIAVAGPLTNFLIALVLAFWLRFLPISSQLGIEFLVSTITINIAFGVFNLIPFPPLDGSRVLYAAAPPLRPLMDRIEEMGMVGLFLLLILGLSIISPMIQVISHGILNVLVPGMTQL